MIIFGFQLSVKNALLIIDPQILITYQKSMSSRSQKLKKLKPKRVISPEVQKEQKQQRNDLRELQRLQQQNQVLQHVIDLVQERIRVMNIIQANQNECKETFSQIRDQLMMREVARPFINRQGQREQRSDEEMRISYSQCVERIGQWFYMIYCEKLIRENQERELYRFGMQQKEQILELQPKIREQFFNQLKNIGISQENILLNRSDGDFNSFLSSIVDYEKSSRELKQFKRFIAGKSNRNQRNPQIQAQSQKEQMQASIEKFEKGQEGEDKEETMMNRRQNIQEMIEDVAHKEENQRVEKGEENTLFESVMQKLKGFIQWVVSMVQVRNSFDYSSKSFQSQ